MAWTLLRTPIPNVVPCTIRYFITSGSLVYRAAYIIDDAAFIFVAIAEHPPFIIVFIIERFLLFLRASIRKFSFRSPKVCLERFGFFLKASIISSLVPTCASL